MKLTRTRDGILLQPEDAFDQECLTAIVKHRDSIRVREVERPNTRHWPPSDENVDVLLEFVPHPWDRKG